MRFKCGICVVSVLALAACGLAEKRAKSLLEQENYDEAVAAYEQIVAREPENLEAVTGLKQARQGALSKRLIDVRKLRQGGSPLGAADLLVATLAQAKAWGVRPPGAAVATEEEEVTFATRYLVGEFETQVKKIQPVATEFMLGRYGSLFEEKGKKALQQFSQTARKQGAELCRRLDQAGFRRKPEYARLVTKVCDRYGIKASLPGASEADLLAQRWGAVALSGKIDGFDEHQIRGLRLALETSLQDHPLYDPKGRKIEAAVSGTYRFNAQKIAVQLLHTYYVEEQYVTTEKVTKTRLTPVQMPGGAIVNQDVSFQEEVPVTRTRTVARQFPYGGWRIVHDGSLEGAIEVVDRRAEGVASLSHQAVLSESGDLNELSNPLIGLHPFAPQLRDPREWIASELKAWAVKFAQALAEWDRTQRCRDSRDDEAVQSCVRVMKGQPTPTFVDEWYRAEFGLNRADFEKVIPL